MLKNRLIYFLSICVAIGFVFIYEDTITYLALYSLLLLPVLSFVIAFRYRKKLEISEKLGKNIIVKGDTVTYYFTLHNLSFFPYPNVKVLFCSDDNAIIASVNKHVFSVDSYDMKVVEFDLKCRFRGTYQVGVREVVLRDMLGLFNFRHKIKHTLSVTVYPKVSEISRLSLVSFEMETTHRLKNDKTEDYTVISDLRQYQPTDSFKKIHWKMTAKKNELIVKNFQIVAKNVTVLAIDNSIIYKRDKKSKLRTSEKEMALTKEDKMMEAFVSVMSYCKKSQYPVEMCYMGGKAAGSFKLETKSFNELYMSAAAIQFDSEQPFEQYLDLLSVQILDFTNIIAFVQHLNDEICEKLLNFKVFGHNVIVFFFPFDNEKDSGAEFADKLIEFGVLCYTIPIGKHMEDTDTII